MQLQTAKKGSLAHTRTNSAAPMQVCYDRLVEQLLGLMHPVPWLS